MSDNDKFRNRLFSQKKNKRKNETLASAQAKLSVAVASHLAILYCGEGRRVWAQENNIRDGLSFSDFATHLAI